MLPGAQVVHVPAGVGINQALRPELVAPGSANLSNRNVRLEKLGGLTRRGGYDAHPVTRQGTTTTARSSGRKVFARKKQTCVTDGEFLDVVALNGATNSNLNIGRLPACSVRRYPTVGVIDTPNIANATKLYEYDFLYCNGYYVVAKFEKSGGVAVDYDLYAYVYRAATMELVNATKLNNGGIASLPKLKIAAIGTVAFFVFGYGTALRVTTLDLTSPVGAGFGIVTVVKNDFADTVLDVCGFGTVVGIYYENNAGVAARIKYVTIDSTSAIVGDITITASANTALTSCSVDGDENEPAAYLAYTQGTHANTRVEVRHPRTGAALAAQISVTSAACNSGGRSLAVKRTGTGTARATWHSLNTPASAWSKFHSVPLSYAAGVVTAGTFTHAAGWESRSKSFVYNGRTYAEAQFDDNTVPTVVLADLTSSATIINPWLRPVTTVAPRLQRYNEPVLAGTVSSASHTCQVGTKKFAAAHLIKSSTAGATIWIVEYDFGATYHACEHDAYAILSCGFPQMYDGAQVHEINFAAPPRIGSVGLGAAGLLNGTYVYTAIHEYVDGAGNVSWSEPAPAVTSPAAVNQQMSVQLRNCTMTSKSVGTTDPANPNWAPGSYRNVRTKLYRTKAGGGEFYLIAIFDDLPTTNDFWTYTDTTSDAAIIGPKLYRHPGLRGTAQARQSPPAFLHVTTYRGMVVGLAEDAQTWWYSGQWIQGEAPWFNNLFTFAVPGEGDCVAGAEQDGRFYVWKRKALYVCDGQPPTDQGGQGGFSPPIRVSSPVGCKDARSLVRTDMGTFFLSDRGMELLDRSGEVRWIGEEVQDTVALYPTCTAATLDPRANVVIFEMATSEVDGLVQNNGTTQAGVRLVFDLTSKCWISIDDMKGSDGTAMYAHQSAALVWTENFYGSFTYAVLEGATGIVRYEIPDQHFDYRTAAHAVTDPIVIEWETASIKLGMLQEHQFWQSTLLFENAGLGGGLTIDVGYNYGAYVGAGNAVNQKTFSAAEVNAAGRMLELRPKTRAAAIRYRVREDGLGYDKGVTFVGISTDLAPHQGSTQGTPRVAATARK